MTDTDHTQESAPDTVPWDRFVKGAAIGAAVVLILFVAIAGVVYFSTDYEFASVAEPVVAAPLQAGDPVNGEAIVKSTGCIACHSTDGSILVGPSWQGLAGSDREFEDGSTAVADTAYLRESILDPEASVVAGFKALMPAIYGDLLTPADIDDVVAYLESLGG
jgi:mono/diheme cytochrome c family protein